MVRLPLACLVAFLLMSPAIASDETRVNLWPAGVAGGPPASAPEEIITADGWTRSTNIQVPYFTVHRAGSAKASGAAVMIVPGGGYGVVAFEHEGTDVARWLNARGVTAFVLRYRHGRDRHPAPLRDVLRAMRLVRSRADEFGIRADRLGVLGFSAGGHLASCAATMFDDAEGRAGDALDAVSARPDFAVLIYPVIALDMQYAHGGSRKNLLGDDAPAAAVAAMSTQNRVTAATPPLFLLHAADDDVVPVENIRAMDVAARKAGVPVELHIFEHGGHGFGMRPDAGSVAIWPELVLGWLRQRGIAQ